MEPASPHITLSQPPKDGGRCCISSRLKGGLSSTTYPVSNLISKCQSNNIVYGQSIFRREGSFIYGSSSNRTNSQCGTPHRQLICSKDKDHGVVTKHICCNDPQCPVCYQKFTHRLADGVIERVLGYGEVYPEDPFYHVIVSPPQNTRYINLKEAFASFSKIFLKYGGKAAVVWYHPYRIKQELKEKLYAVKEQWIKDNPGKFPPGFWKFAHDDVLKLGGLGEYLVYGPHFHAVATGYLLDSKSFFEQTCGWIYKKVKRDEGEDLPDSSTYAMTQRDLERIAHYISTHTAYEWTKHSVRYVGDISYSKLGRKDKKRERISVVCLKCGSPMVEYFINQLTGELGDLTGEEVTQRIITWQYYKRPKRKRKVT